MPSDTSNRVDDADQAGLKEKYLHSHGAALYDEGRFDEAIDFFERAITLDDQSYTHYHLCLTYVEKKDFDKALREINRAIELKPSVAKYYDRRSQIWQSRGDRTRADEDRDRAIELDGNYAHVQRIRSSYGTVEQAFSNDEMLEWCSTVRPKGEELSSVVRDLGKSLGEERQALEAASCALPCPAYCCHFSGETIRHGVHIGAWKLSAIRSLLKEKHLPESDFLGRISFTGEEHFVRLIPPHYVVKERGEAFVYYPKRGGKALGKALLQDLPKAKEYQELLWINEKSKACAFLYAGKCMIHDLGGEPGLPACKEFLCMTGFVFAVLDHLGMVEGSQLRTRSMAELNRLAVKAVLIIGETLYDERLTRLRTAGYEALKAAVEADVGDASREVDRCLTKYRRLTEEFQDLFTTQREVAKRRIETVFRGSA
jgi:tetratricopeptide (TPR) repeat protein